jgi:hypothetical protein
MPDGIRSVATMGRSTSSGLSLRAVAIGVTREISTVVGGAILATLVATRPFRGRFDGGAVIALGTLISTVTNNPKLTYVLVDAPRNLPIGSSTDLRRFTEQWSASREMRRQRFGCQCRIGHVTTWEIRKLAVARFLSSETRATCSPPPMTVE